MINITCTNCQASLTMDDAFAGGVCRCQHCGTIQTVPKGGVAQQAASKTLWKQKTVSEASPGTGLDDLADIVASSGLAGSGLQSRSLRKPSPPAKNNKLIGILAGAGAAVLIGVIVLVWVLFGRGSDTPADGDQQIVTSSGKTIVMAGPNFAGIKLDDASNVSYVIDRGSGTAAVFSEAKVLTIKSIRSLGGDRKFQIVFWASRGATESYPGEGLTVAGDLSVGEAVRRMDDVAAFGSTDAIPALKKAAAAKPDTILLVTGKGADLDPSFIDAVAAELPKGVKLHAVALGPPSDVLRDLAKKTGGEYHHFTAEDLSAMMR